MNRILLTAVVLFLAFCQHINAQKYYVYQFEGNVKVQQGKEMKAVELRQPLKENQKVFVDDGARLKVLDMTNHQFHTITGKATGTISDMPEETKEITAVSKKYLTYVYDQMFRRQPISRMSSTATTVYRDVFDSDENDSNNGELVDSIQYTGTNKYYVYQTLNATIVVDGEERLLEARQELSAGDEIILSDDAKIKIFAPAEKVFILVGKAGKYTISELISDMSHKHSSIRDERFITVCDQVFGGEPIP